MRRGHKSGLLAFLWGRAAPSARGGRLSRWRTRGRWRRAARAAPVESTRLPGHSSSAQPHSLIAIWSSKTYPCLWFRACGRTSPRTPQRERATLRAHPRESAQPRASSLRARSAALLSSRAQRRVSSLRARSAASPPLRARSAASPPLRARSAASPPPAREAPRLLSSRLSAREAVQPHARKYVELADLGTIRSRL